MKKNTAEQVAKIVAPYAEQLGLELYDVEYVKEGADYFLRIYIDKSDGYVDINDCENLSRTIDPVLDEADPIKDSYYLEVSSVGLDRPLKLEKDFIRFMGEKIDVRLFKAKDGVKEYYGRLCDYKDGEFTVECDNGKQITATVKEASLIRPHLDF